MQIPTDFLTLDVLLTFTGATVASWLVPYAIFMLVGEKFRPYMKWVSFVVAIALMVLAAFISEDASWTKYIVAAFNGLIIFLSAIGANTVAANATMKVNEVERGDVQDQVELNMAASPHTVVALDSNGTTLVATEGMFKHWF